MTGTIDKNHDGYVRFFDIVIAVLGAVILFPFLLVIAIAIKTTSPGPVFYRQFRLGKNGRHFLIFKFRTMVDGAEHVGLKLLTSEEDTRITGVGKFLRAWSIDELPQIINVIKGEMGLVGPRPATTNYLELYDRRQLRRLEVPPGITGWAQVNGRNSLTWPQRIECDVWYVDHRSLALNLKIILRTFPVLFQKDGLYGALGNFDMSGTNDRQIETLPTARVEAVNPLYNETTEKTSKENVPQAV